MSQHQKSTVRLVVITAIAATVFPISASAASAVSEPLISSLPVEFSSDETQPPPESTEVQPCVTNGEREPEVGEPTDPQITRIEGGGRKYSYAIPGSPEDEYMTVNEPPKGFDPLKASAEKLQTWGFPPRPKNEDGREEWRDLVGGYKEAYVGPGCEGAATHNTLGTQRTPSWSGYEAENPGQPYVWTAIIGNFYQPYDHGSCSISAEESSWVGIGGDFSNRFIQSGTEVEVGGAMRPWIEIWSAEGGKATGGWDYKIPGFPLQPQAYIRLYAGYNPSLEIAYFYITNDNTGQTILNEWHIGAKYYDGDSVEWIDEAPQYLLNFGQVTWWSNSAQTYQNYVYPIEPVNNYKLAIWNNGHVVAAPESLWNQTNFTDVYHSCN
jgi:hypothetical protein